MRVERQVNKLENNLLQMRDHTLKMYELLKKAISKEEVDYDEIKILDEKVNECEEDVLQEAIISLALLSPVASDLRTMVSCIRISNEMERIADYAKNISEHYKYSCLHSTTLKNMILALIDEFCADFNLVVEGFIARNTKVAYDIKQKMEVYDAQFVTIFKLINEKESGSFQQLYPIYTTFKSIERAKDHMLNMCESILYLNTGKFYNFG